jgi:hypothetical protein
MRGFVTNNNGFWIEWLNLLALLLQIQPTITAHNQWLSKTRSIPYWTASVFSFAVTDLVLIYESVTSSASIVRWLTLHSWTLNSLTNSEWLISPELNYLPGEPNIRKSPCLTVLLLFCFVFVSTGTCLPNRCQAMDYSAAIRYSGKNAYRTVA